MQNIIIFGAGGHAKAVIDTVEKTGLYQIVGILDGYKPVGSKFYGYEILGDESWLTSSKSLVYSGIVAIGDNWTRASVVAKIKDIMPSFTFITAIHPTASVARGAQIGSGTVLMAGCIVGSDARISDHCVMYAMSVIEHDSQLGHYVTLAPKACTGGNVIICDYTVVSIGAAIIHGKTIGEHAVIGAGSTVLSHIDAFSVAYGTPAKVIRTRVQGERYL
ncbi:acetyltransferase [Paenibacillus sinopodophylli]|uniref:acetyltransferase n=1 Tax=Paenibacillus sinopodophylli TaxID=1837342 RepID=UPI00110CD18C|nr:acetyltransferase [Paenibacillus sinopodophylli]